MFVQCDNRSERARYGAGPLAITAQKGAANVF